MTPTTLSTCFTGRCFVAVLFIVEVLFTQDGQALLTQLERQEISDFIQTVLECRNVPGLALGIVFGDGDNPEDVFSAGFGSANIQTNATVTNATRFAVGTLSETFTTTLIARLLHVKKEKYPLGWDTPVKQIVGVDFKLYDELRTEYITLRDLAAHKAGFPHYHSTMCGLDKTVKRSEYCRRYFLLKPTSEFRTEYSYSKEMFTLLGCVAEILGDGLSWEELVTSIFLKPLSMTSTTFVPSAENLAVPYVYHKDSFLPLNNSLLRAIYPYEVTEGVVSTADDMIRWLHYHIFNVGNVSRIQEGRVMEQIYLPQVQYKLSKMKEFAPDSQVNQLIFAHSMGWESGSYRGYRFVQQDGHLPGYTSKLAIFMDMQLGVFITMNSGSSKMDAVTVDIILWKIADLLLRTGRPLFLLPEKACSHEYPFAHKQLSIPNSPLIQPTRVPRGHSVSTQNREPGWESTYAGSYGHQVFGNITISYDELKGALTCHLGLLGDGILQDTGKKETFSLEFLGPLSYIQQVQPEKQITLAFENLEGGQFTKLRVPDDQLEYTRNVKWEITQNSGPYTSCSVYLLSLLVLVKVIYFDV